MFVSRSGLLRAGAAQCASSYPTARRSAKTRRGGDHWRWWWPPQQRGYRLALPVPPRGDRQGRGGERRAPRTSPTRPQDSRPRPLSGGPTRRVASCFLPEPLPKRKQLLEGSKGAGGCSEHCWPTPRTTAGRRSPAGLAQPVHRTSGRSSQDPFYHRRAKGDSNCVDFITGLSAARESGTPGDGRVDG